MQPAATGTAALLQPGVRAEDSHRCRVCGANRPSAVALSYRKWLRWHGAYSCAPIASASWPTDALDHEWPTPMSADAMRGAGSTFRRGNPTLGLAARDFDVDMHFGVDADEPNSEEVDMAVVSINYNEPVNRKSPERVLGIEDSAPSSRGSTFWRRLQQCPREHFLANVVQFAPIRRSDPLDVGLVWHYALEEYYKRVQLQQQKQPIDEAPDTAAFKIVNAFAHEPGWTEHYSKLVRMLDSYFDKFHATESKEWEILAVEETLMVGAEVGYGFEYSTRLDLVVIDHAFRQRATRIIEHKSASRLDHNTITGYLLDQQVLGQIWLAEVGLDHEAYPPFMGSYVNVTTKPTAESGKGALPEHVRLPVAPSTPMLAGWEDAMRYWQRQRDAIETEGEYPRNHALCKRTFGRCPFFNLCQGSPELGAKDFVQLRKKNAEPPEGYRFANQWDDEETT